MQRLPLLIKTFFKIGVYGLLDLEVPFLGQLRLVRMFGYTTMHLPEKGARGPDGQPQGRGAGIKHESAEVQHDHFKSVAGLESLFDHRLQGCKDVFGFLDRGCDLEFLSTIRCQQRETGESCAFATHVSGKCENHPHGSLHKITVVELAHSGLGDSRNRSGTDDLMGEARIMAGLTPHISETASGL